MNADRLWERTQNVRKAEKPHKIGVVEKVKDYLFAKCQQEADHGKDYAEFGYDEGWPDSKSESEHGAEIRTFFESIGFTIVSGDNVYKIYWRPNMDDNTLDVQTPSIPDLTSRMFWLFEPRGDRVEAPPRIDQQKVCAAVMCHETNSVCTCFEHS